MKVKVYDFRCVNDNYWVNGVSTFYENKEYINRCVDLRVNKDMFEKNVKVPIKFPLVLDVKFKKGVGISELKTL